MKIILAGILGGIAMFIWTSVVHMFLPLGETGISEIPNEQTVLAALQSNIGDKTGLYVFPGPGVGANPSRAQKNEAMKGLAEKYASNPSGIMMYHPPGRPFEIVKHLGIEFITEVLEAFVAVFLLAQTAIASFSGRVGFVTVAGILAALATNVSYWNWYGFPTDYIVAYMSIQVIGFICVGIVTALILGKRAPRTA